MQRTLLAGVLIVALCLAPPAAATASGESVTVTVNGTAETYDAASTYTFDLVVTNTSDSVGAYELTLAASEDLTIESYEPTAPLGALGSASISDDGRTLDIFAANANVQSQDGVATLGTVTVRTGPNGSASLTPDVTTVTDDDGSQYDATAQAFGFQVGNDAAPVEALPDASGPPRNVDDDPRLEDVNGDGSADLFDALDYYNNRKSTTIQDNVAAFDFDDDGESGTLFDALALWNEISG
jgi:hypothetical protein